MRVDGLAAPAGAPEETGDAATLGEPLGFGSPAGLESAPEGFGSTAGAGGSAVCSSSSDTIHPLTPLAGSRTLRQRRPPPSRSAPISSSSVPSRIVRTRAPLGDGSARMLAPCPSVLTTLARPAESALAPDDEPGFR